MSTAKPWWKNRTLLAMLTKRTMVVAIAVAAAYVSYWHIVGVTTYAGETYLSAHLLPIIPDATMILGAVLILDDRRRKCSPRIYARLGQIFGLSMSLLGNATDAIIRDHGLGVSHTVVSLMVAVGCAIFLFLTSEMLLHSGTPLPKRRKRPARKPATAPARRTAPKIASVTPIAVTA